MEDLILTCIQCEVSFVFSVGEQQRYAFYNFDAPMRCPECRRKKTRPNQNDHGRTQGKKKKMKRYKKTSDLFLNGGERNHGYF